VVLQELAGMMEFQVMMDPIQVGGLMGVFLLLPDLVILGRMIR
jgi:hypothetical protein